jgi:xanthine dehydrogenase accessory factor
VSDTHVHDPECAVAHGDVPSPTHPDRVLVVAFATPVAAYLLRWARDLGFRTVLVEPDRDALGADHREAADEVVSDPADAGVDGDTDVVVTDHHRGDLGAVMAPLVTAGPRWVGIMGSARHDPPHVPALRDLGVDEALIATVHRPIGLAIGSKAPAEIALATLAGLLADRNGRSGGFAAPRTAARA